MDDSCVNVNRGMVFMSCVAILSQVTRKYRRTKCEVEVISTYSNEVRGVI